MIIVEFRKQMGAAHRRLLRPMWVTTHGFDLEAAVAAASAK